MKEYNDKTHYVNTVLSKIKVDYNLNSDTELATFLGIKPSALSMQRSRASLDFQNIIERCTRSDLNWLFRHDQAFTDMKLSDESEVIQKIDTSDEIRLILNRLQSEKVSAEEKVAQLEKQLLKANHQIEILKELIRK